MSNPRDIRVKNVQIEFEPIPFRAPLKFGGRTVTQTELINATVVVEDRSGNRATGTGSMPVGNVWSWPSSLLASARTEQAMKNFAWRSSENLVADAEFGHPIDLMVRHLQTQESIAQSTVQELELPERIPRLAQRVATSSFDAALHDAYGKLHRTNAYLTLSSEFVNHDLSHYLGSEFQGEYLDQYVRKQPRGRLPLYHLVGALDPLTDYDLVEPVDDGLPETLAQWIAADGLTHLKIKLNGADLDWDLQRLRAIEQVAVDAQTQRRCPQWYYSLDFNEKCQDVEYVLQFLDQLKHDSPEAFARVQYIEQPTDRDLEKYPDNRMHLAAVIKPVVIDESLIDLNSLTLAQELGYTGVALKACKGQTETLLLAAAAIKRKLFLCVQDLTCPGFSFLHSASLAARIPGVAAIEGNGRQYCPGPNAKFAVDYPGMFHITDGTVASECLTGVGLF